MAYIFDTILKAEKYEFVLCQNRHNSKVSSLLAFSKDDKMIPIGTVNNRTNAVTVDQNQFKQVTIDKLIQKLRLKNEPII